MLKIAIRGSWLIRVTRCQPSISINGDKKDDYKLFYYVSDLQHNYSYDNHLSQYYGVTFMIFHVISRKQIIAKQEGHAYLIEDDWNDWWEFSTLYFLQIVHNNTLEDIGSVKIGQHNLEPTQDKILRPALPCEFTTLSDDFFSLGQDDYYYENVKNLGDGMRISCLTALRDIAFDLKIYKNFKADYVMDRSIMRSISSWTVSNQFHRIASGGARLTHYNFTYHSEPKDNSIESVELGFKVKPESTPATNIHVIIGRNGVGKTFLITNMIRSILKGTNVVPYVGEVTFDGIKERNHFSRVILVSFSAFDEPLVRSESKRYIRIGLPQNPNSTTELSQDKLADKFLSSLIACVNELKKDLLSETLATLETDPMFVESGITELCVSYASSKNDDEIKKTFSRLSSGHKIILLSLIQLVENVTEQTIVFLDEPEGHLHPPLLATFVRALSDLLFKKNGVAIIATHSPVILQEVPKSCVWRLRRKGAYVKADRLQIESFGADIGSLTNEVFGLEVMNSGFHGLLQKLVHEGYDYDAVLSKLDDQLGAEGRCILRELIALKEESSKDEPNDT